jgi:hypothetical protein
MTATCKGHSDIFDAYACEVCNPRGACRICTRTGIHTHLIPEHVYQALRIEPPKPQPCDVCDLGDGTKLDTQFGPSLLLCERCWGHVNTKARGGRGWIPPANAMAWQWVFAIMIFCALVWWL